jgi:hypothetical protein
MTTIEAAVASARTIRLATVAAVFAVSVAGCSSGGGDFSLGSNQVAPAPATTSATPAASGPRIAIAPAIGPPQSVTDQLTQSLTSALEQQKVSVAKTQADRADFTLRGYVVAAKDKAGTKFSYIWDVTDPAGKRVNRITGEDMAPGPAGADPWSAMSPQLMQAVAGKTASSIGAWLPTQSTASVASNAPSGVGATTAAAAPAAATAAPAAAPAAAKQQVAAAGPAAGTTLAVVQRVAGAPGDGSVALTSAIQRELGRNGVSVADQATPGQNAYRVEGKVKLGEARDGKQPIQIDWDVKDNSGRKLGTVSQKNEVPQGSLDGAWGQTADAAAAAAAQGILKLMPAQKATN